jgi:chemotaxis protein methyltransferase CheR
MNASVDTHECKVLLESIRQTYGYDFTDYAEMSVKRRIAHFMGGRNIGSVAALHDLLLRDEQLFEEFVQGLSVTVTEMFRDPGFYRCIREKVMKRLATYPVIRIWIAGCATGEEVYSMAIVLQEEGLLQRSIIYATDINQQSLKTAKDGVYSLQTMKTYTANYLLSGGKRSFSEYYTAKYDSVLFQQSLRENVVFSPHNLVADKSFNEFQLIICRNVIMYFNQTLQDKVIDLFYDSLCPFGFLGLGDKESMLFSGKRNLFEETDSREKIYRKTK